MEGSSFFKNKLTRYSFIAIGSVLVVGLLLFFLRNDIIRRSDLVKDLKLRLASRNRAVSSYVTLKEDLQTAREYERILENRLPIRESLINFKKEVTDLALRDNVEIGFTFGETQTVETEPDFERLVFSVSSRGLYEDNLAFLERLESHRYFIGVSTISLTKEQDDMYRGVFTGVIVTQRDQIEDLQNE